MLDRSPTLASFRPQSVAAGFTLFEVITVVVLLGIFAVVVRPKPNIDGLKVGAQTRTLAADLQRAQVWALNGNKVLFCTTATTDTSTAGYLIALNTNFTACSGTGFPSAIASTPVSANYPVVVSLGKNIGFATTTADLNFNSLGRPVTSDGKTALPGQFKLKTPAGANKLVTVDATSGLIRIAP